MSKTRDPKKNFSTSGNKAVGERVDHDPNIAAPEMDITEGRAIVRIGHCKQLGREGGTCAAGKEWQLRHRFGIIYWH